MEAEAIEKIRAALSGVALAAVYVFGSEAKQRTRPDSDVDLAILPLVALTPVRVFELATELSERLGRDVDLIDLSRATTVLCKEVVAHGQVLFEADPLKRAEFEMYTLSDYARLNEERAPILARLGQPLRNA